MLLNMPIEVSTSVTDGNRTLARVLSDIGHGPHDWNEADTRFQFINRLIVECLGWPRDEVRTEKHEAGDYADYELGNPRKVIWEAKRVGRVFELPANPRRRTISQLSSLMAISSELSQAIKQTQSYCSARGVDLAVVTNGPQLVPFLATRNDGLSPFDGKCFVIDGLNQLREEFPKLWQLLSPQGVADRNLKHLLSFGHDEIKAPPKSSVYIKNYPGFRRQTDAQKDLQIISELLLSDVAEWPETQTEFYKRCYCAQREISRYSVISKEIVEARNASLFAEHEAAPNLIPLRKAGWRGLLADELVTEALLQRPIVLLGEIGSGKTAFLKNLILVDGAPEFEKTICVYVDLSSKGAIDIDMRRFILYEIENQLLRRYGIDIVDNAFIQSVYVDDLERFEKGIFGSWRAESPTLYAQKRVEFLEQKITARHEHVGRAISYITSTSKRQVVIILDNSDQRANQIQIEVFATAQEISRSWGALVFVSLRPETYLQIRHKISSGKRAERVFLITAPAIEDALRRRLDFAVDIAEGRLPIQKLEGVELDLASFSAVAKSFSNALKTGHGIITFFSNFYADNVTDAVQAVCSFFGSPNVDTQRIARCSRVREGSGHCISLRDVCRSVLYGQFNHYNPKTSPALNVFDIGGNHAAEHFLLPIILAFLHQHGPHRGKDGFVSARLILAEMQNYGFNIAATTWALTSASTREKQLLQRALDNDIRDVEANKFRLTRSGAYYLYWLTNSIYLEAMSCDTPIFDEHVRRALIDGADQHSSEARKFRSISLGEYLTTVWEKSGLEPQYFQWSVDLMDLDRPSKHRVPNQ